MYTVFVDGGCIHDDISPSKDLKLLTPKLTLADNAAGSFSFSMAPSNPGIDLITRMKSEIVVYRGDKRIWAGRATSADTDFWGNYAYSCEGELAYLNDILQPAAAYDNYTIVQFLQAVIANYNSKASSNRQFQVGIVTQNDLIYGGTVSQLITTTTNMSSTFDVIKTVLLDVYEGHLRVRYENGVRYLDYLEDYNEANEQTINFGQNLLDYASNWDDTELITRIYPRGKEIEDSDETDYLSYKLNKTRHKRDNQYDVEFQFSFKNYVVPADSQYDYRIALTLYDYRQANPSVTVYGDIWTLDPNTIVNQSWNYIVRDYAPGVTYGFAVQVEYKVHDDETSETSIQNAWVDLGDEYIVARDLNNDAGSYTIATSNGYITGTITNTYESDSSVNFRTMIDLTFHNPGTPSDGRYDYTMRFYFTDPVGGIIQTATNSYTVNAGSTGNMSWATTHNGLKSYRHYEYQARIFRRKNAASSWTSLGDNFGFPELHFDAHFTNNELDGIEKRVTTIDAVVNGSTYGLDYIEKDDILATYGRIERAVTWDYIDDPTKLYTLGLWYLEDYQFDNMILQVTALDLNYLNPDMYTQIELLDQIRAISPVHGMNRVFPVTKLEIPLDHPENTTYTLATKQRNSYTTSVGDTTNDIYNQMGSFPTSSDILKQIGSAGYRMLVNAKENAAAILNARTNGTITITEGDDGYSDAIWFTDTKDYTQASQYWKWDMNGLGFYDTENDDAPLVVGITKDGSINADAITVGTLLAAYIRLYGLMSVYKQSTGTDIGGYIGYGEGSQPDGNGGYTATSGLMISNTKRTVNGVEEPGYLRYFITTNSGVRMQAGAQKIWFNDDASGGSGALIVSNDFTINASEVRVQPPWEWSDEDADQSVTYNQGVSGYYPLGSGYLRFNKGFLVRSYPFGGISRGDLGSEVELGNANIVIKNGLVTHITAWPMANYQNDINTCLNAANAAQSDATTALSYFMQINDAYGDLRLRSKPNGFVRLEADDTSVCMKSDDNTRFFCGVNDSNETVATMKLDSDNYIVCKSTELTAKYNTGKFMSITSSKSVLSYRGGQNGDYGINIEIFSGGMHFNAGSHQAWVSTQSGLGPLSSDRRFKEDIHYDVDGDILDGLKPARFKFKNTERERYGFIAQDVQEVVESIVEPDREGKRLYLYYNDIIAILTAKVQKQQKKIDELEERIARLESLIETGGR